MNIILNFSVFSSVLVASTSAVDCLVRLVTEISDLYFVEWDVELYYYQYYPFSCPCLPPFSYCSALPLS